MDDIYALMLEIRTLMGVISKIVRQNMEQRLQSEGIELSHLQFITLRVLDYEGAHTITDLGRKLMLDPSTFVPSVDALERRGWVCRMRDPNDRRRVPISLTPEGKAMIDRLDMVTEDDPGFIALQKMGVEKAQLMVELLRDLVQHLPDGQLVYEGVQARLKLSQNPPDKPEIV